MSDDQEVETQESILDFEAPPAKQKSTKKQDTEEINFNLKAAMADFRAFCRKEEVLTVKSADHLFGEMEECGEDETTEDFRKPPQLRRKMSVISEDTIEDVTETVHEEQVNCTSPVETHRQLPDYNMAFAIATLKLKLYTKNVLNNRNSYLTRNRPSTSRPGDSNFESNNGKLLELVTKIVQQQTIMKSMLSGVMQDIAEINKKLDKVSVNDLVDEDSIYMKCNLPVDNENDFELFENQLKNE
ncbi:hypothetical protein FQR65_LT17729 [Abscondita terminalis]|nr:hypothetical protein FQR65_LT17729 [Abscondita terminalis]